MARIRSIKPEFPHSESMGRVSRDARLTFIQLWTLADDAGRLRGNSRMLASLLFPYDDDAPGLIDEWLSQLEGEDCIVRYQHDGTSYVQICNWLNHQKIDKPSASKIPEFDEASRIVSKPRECSSGDQGLDQRIKDQGKEGKGSISAAAPPTRIAVSRESTPKEWFLDFKLEYPDRAGDQLWRKAERAANARIAEGHTTAEMIEGAKRYAVFCKASGKAGTEFVKQAATFLGPEKSFLLPWHPPPLKRENEMISPGERVRRAAEANGNGRVVSEQFGASVIDMAEPGGYVRPALPS